MSLTYVHVSDIHFGQERGSEVFVHDDVKQCLIADVEEFKTTTGIKQLDGVIVTGDIAFSGKKCEYDRAARWLDRLTEAAGCEKTDVILVPGNHDIDRDQITFAAELACCHVRTYGNDKLDCLLSDARDTELLYAKLRDYRRFAEAYNCPLELNGGVAVNRKATIAPGRFLRFVGLNSALLCSKGGGDEGQLLIGAKQHVLPRTRGEELVVLCHHPLESLQDKKDVSRYINSRARVHIYGHVHRPSVAVDVRAEKGDLLTMSAGAVVPPKSQDGYQYTYNVLTFEWDAKSDGLKIEIVPRSWNELTTTFDADKSQFGGSPFQGVLRCPNFKNQAEAPGKSAASDKPAIEAGQAPKRPLTDVPGGTDMEKSSDLLRLRFFRDLSAAQRLRALTQVGVLPEKWTIELTHTVERRLLDQALSSGVQDELAAAVAVLRTDGVAAERGAER